MNKSIVNIILFIFSVGCAVSQPLFRLEAPAIATTDEQIKVRFVLRDARGSNLRPPSFAGFIIASGPKKSTNSERGHTYESYEYVLIPSKAGVMRIDPALIYAGNSAVKSNSAEVRVSEPYYKNSNSENLSSGQTIQDAQAGRPFMRSNFSQKRSYINYPVVLMYWLYVPSSLEVSSVDIAKRISFANATSREIDVSREQPKELVIGGVKYRAYVLKKYIISALSAQSFATGEFSVRGESAAWTKDEYGRRQRVTNEFVVTAESVFMEFVELPTPKPEPNALPFKSLSVVSEIDRDKYKIGESAVYRIVVSGSGQLESLEAPSVQAPSGTILVSQNAVDDVHCGDSAVFGRRVFEYVFELKGQGMVEFPAVPIVYFDIEAGNYRTATAMAKRVSVEASGAEAIEVGKGNGVSVSVWMGIAFFTLLCGVLASAFIIANRRKKSRDANQQNPADGQQPQGHKNEQTPRTGDLNNSFKRLGNNSALEMLCELLSAGEMEKFFAMAEVFVRQQAATADTTNPTTEEIEALLHRKGIPIEKILQIMSVVERIEFAIYTSTYSKPAADSILNDLIRLFAEGKE